MFIIDNYANLVGFKILDIELIEHDILGTNKFNFVDLTDSPESIYFSVLIGPNGTGKSELLYVILALFRSICNLENDKSPQYISGYYRINYFSNGSVYTFTNYTKNKNDNVIESITEDIINKVRPFLLKNGIKAPFKDAITTLPGAIVANSIMLTDKYFVLRNEEEEKLFPMYKYLGVRNRPQQASTRSYVRKTVEFVVEQIDSTVFKDGLNSITKFLGLSNSLNIIFYTIYTTRFYKGNLQQEDLDNYFSEIEEKYKFSETIAPFKVNRYNTLKKQDGLIEELCIFVNKLYINDKLGHINKSSKKKIIYNIIDNQSHSELKNDYFFLDILRQLGFLSNPEITLKREDDIHLQDSSSGEFHFFSTMVGLMATVVPNSLILIDEPEISLHPNWQMQYLNFTRKLFSSDKYKTCQIIIATHSHFLISDLQGSSSKIIGMKRNKGKLNTLDIDANTFGWSAEEVLYKIFDVRTTRNHYLEMDLRKMLGLIADKSKDRGQINKILKRVKEVQLDENDPLRLIINQVEEYLD
jgi:predicted ATP-dependent endonuclease of OLD family